MTKNASLEDRLLSLEEEYTILTVTPDDTLVRDVRRRFLMAQDAKTAACFAGELDALRGQLAEAQADMRALVKAFRAVYVNRSGREVRSTALARPGVKRLTEEA